MSMLDGGIATRAATMFDEVGDRCIAPILAFFLTTSSRYHNFLSPQGSGYRLFIQRLVLKNV
jgi:hypothetical protein